MKIQPLYIFMATTAAAIRTSLPRFPVESKPLGSLLKDLTNHRVSDLFLSPDLGTAYTLPEGADPDLPPMADTTIIHPSLANTLVDTAVKSGVETHIMQVPSSPLAQTFADIQSTVGGLFSFVFPILIMVALARMLGLGVGPGRSPGSGPGYIPGITPAQFTDPIKTGNITLQDWAGSPEIFRECTEVISYFRNSTQYRRAGAEIPKGVLLEGPPGTGKTLMAKAIANEAGVKMFSLSASEFVELFVGAGAAKVRQLFRAARINAPCIVFIDEIDAVGKSRNSGGGGGFSGNDEREQTLNQLLFEMDGFESNEGIVVMAATNRRDVLDPALLRPGRFDRLIQVPLPDRTSRRTMLGKFLTSRGKTPAVGLDYEGLADRTAGMSGAEIQNVVNEAAIYAARAAREVIQPEDIHDALEKSTVGILKQVDSRDEETIRRVAVHEVGHAFLAAAFPQFFLLDKVSIQATYSGAGGYTLFRELPELVDGGLYTRELLQARLVVALGGRAAETLVYGEERVSTGASQDLKQANELARNMVVQYGMGDDLTAFWGGGGPPTSEATKAKVDAAIAALVGEAYGTALQLLAESRPAFLSIVDTLRERRVLTGEDFGSVTPFLN